MKGARENYLQVLQRIPGHIKAQQFPAAKTWPP
jgi:hypothetical protein